MQSRSGSPGEEFRMTDTLSDAAGSNKANRHFLLRASAGGHIRRAAALSPDTWVLACSLLCRVSSHRHSQAGSGV